MTDKDKTLDLLRRFYNAVQWAIDEGATELARLGWQPELKEVREALAIGSIHIVVLNEHTMGYMEANANFINVLQSLVHKGAVWTSNASEIKYIDKDDVVRLANEADFKEFRISIDGYKNDPKYVFDRG
jgi:hypothetical protein